MGTLAMGLEDGKPIQVKALDLGSQGEPKENPQSWVANEAQWTPEGVKTVLAANNGPDKPYEKQVRELMGTEDNYVSTSRNGLRQSVNEMSTNGPHLTSKSTFEEVENKVAQVTAEGFGPKSTWSQSYKNEVMQRLKLGNPNMTEAMAANKDSVYSALIAGDRKQAAEVLGPAGSTASGQQLEDAVNRYQYRYMQKHGIKIDRT